MIPAGIQFYLTASDYSAKKSFQEAVHHPGHDLISYPVPDCSLTSTITY